MPVTIPIGVLLDKAKLQNIDELYELIERSHDLISLSGDTEKSERLEVTEKLIKLRKAVSFINSIKQ